MILENQEEWTTANNVEVNLSCLDDSVVLSNAQFSFNTLEAGVSSSNEIPVEVVLGEIPANNLKKEMLIKMSEL